MIKYQKIIANLTEQACITNVLFNFDNIDMSGLKFRRFEAIANRLYYEVITIYIDINTVIVTIK